MFRRASFWLTLAAILFCFLTLVSADAVETPEAGKTEAAEAAESVEAAEETFEGPSFVLTLDSTNFTENVAQHGFILVEFYAPWCGHCKNLVPEYEKAAAILSEHDPPIVLAKVDATNETNKELAAQFEVRSYPTMKILRNGGQVMQEYKGPRVADGIVEYLKRQRGPAAIEIKSADYVNKLLGELKIVVVGVFSEFSGEPYENFTDFSEKMRSDYEFAYTSDAKILPYGESSVTGPVVRLFKPFDEHYVDFKDFNPEALVEFVQEASTPILAVYDGNPANHPFVVKFYNSPHSKAMLFVNFTLEGFDSMKSKYYEIAKQYNDQGISFLVGDANVSKAAFDYFGVKESQLPLIIIQTIDGRRYLKATLEADDIAPWVKDFKEGKLPVYIKSEPVPEENDEPVKVVVANTLEEMVFKSGKNVLLEFYAPWCGHCKKLAPILEEVAVHYESDDNVMIAKFDATANDVTNANFEVQGYPTMYFKSVDGNITSFEGNRTKEDIIEFIEKNRVKFVTEEIEPSVSLKDEL